MFITSYLWGSVAGRCVVLWCGGDLCSASLRLRTAGLSIDCSDHNIVTRLLIGPLSSFLIPDWWRSSTLSLAQIVVLYICSWDTKKTVRGSFEDKSLEKKIKKWIERSTREWDTRATWAATTAPATGRDRGNPESVSQNLYLKL